MQLLAGFLSAREAHIFKTRLEASNIGAFIQGEDFVNMYWPFAMAIGGVRVYVVEADLECAHAVIADCLAGRYRRELEAEFGDLDDTKCPRCGSASFKSRSSRLDMAMLAATFFLSGIIFPARARVHVCDACGHRWHDD